MAARVLPPHSSRYFQQNKRFPKFEYRDEFLGVSADRLHFF
jgi:hypothetical protein